MILVYKKKKILLGNLVRTAVQLAIYMHTPFLSGNSGISGFYKMHMVSFPRMCLIHEPSQVISMLSFLSSRIINSAATHGHSACVHPTVPCATNLIKEYLIPQTPNLAFLI